jgi:negative regulator of sigma-B (phosphoserine phosphatase)
VIRAVAGTCVRPLPGEEVAGDACLALPWSRGMVVVVSDGLGHGPAAAEASRVLLAHVRDAIEMPLEQIFSGAHRALRGTRGAVATIARIDEGAGRIEVAGIGNVTTRLYQGAAMPLHVLVPGGVLGGAYRPTRTQSVSFAVGDLLVMHTDGIRSRFDLEPLRALPPEELARAVVGAHGKAIDDAACAVVRAEPPRVPVGSHEGDRLAMPIRLPGDAECCAVGARAFTGRLGFDVRRQWEVSIAVSELATNVLRHADEGILTLSRATDPPERVVVEIVDRAREAPIEERGGARAADGPRPARGLGVGLECVHRMMDHVAIEAIETSPRGRRVVAWKYR